MTFNVPVTWVMVATVKIDAENVDDAYRKALALTPLPNNGEYLSDSFNVDFHSIEEEIE